MRKLSITLLPFLFLISCQGQKPEATQTTNWCPKGLKLNGYAYVEGIVDYENINWCKMVITTSNSTYEILYTQDGTRELISQYKEGKKRTEVRIGHTKSTLKLYDTNGNLVEEVSTKERF